MRYDPLTQIQETFLPGFQILGWGSSVFLVVAGTADCYQVIFIAVRGITIDVVDFEIIHFIPSRSAPGADVILFISIVPESLPMPGSGSIMFLGASHPYFVESILGASI